MSTARAVPGRLAALLVLVLSLAVLLVQPSAAQAAAGRPVLLTGNEQRVVLGLIDDACGDTWCEGDYRFDFRAFSCDRASRTCTLRLRLAPYTDGQQRWYWRSGTLAGFSRFGQLVQTSATGQQSLQPDFYAAVDALIGRLEATVPATGQPGPTLQGQA